MSAVLSVPTSAPVEDAAGAGERTTRSTKARFKLAESSAGPLVSGGDVAEATAARGVSGDDHVEINRRAAE